MRCGRDRGSRVIEGWTILGWIPRGDVREEREIKKIIERKAE